MKDLTHLANDEEFQEKLKDFSRMYFIKETKKLSGIIKIRKIETKDFNNFWTELKADFKEKQNSRCAICEKELNDIYSQDIEHYRPKTIYWWLAYNPENYYLACAECNRSYKKIEFPLLNQTQHTNYLDRKNIKNEIPLLVNPLKDNPLDYFQIVFIIHHKTNKKIATLKPKKGINDEMKQKAEKTIEIYNLDLNSYSNLTDESRFDLLHGFYNILIELAEARKTKNKDEFISVLSYKLHHREELKTLDLLKLILKNQFEINYFN